jgi:predicted metal-dependent enzyme (double-stranded beta helix superfamily)
MNQDETDKTASEQEWPDSLDAMVAAPEHHEVLLENERVRVLDSRIKPGDTVPVHTHRWASVLHILGTSDFIRYDPEGNTVFDSRTKESSIEVGTVTWSAPLSAHSVENVGDTEIRVISIELKD